MTDRLSILSVPFFVLVGGMLLFSTVPAFGQTLEDVMRYSKRLPTAGGPGAGMAGGGLFAGTAGPSAIYGNPAGLGWISTSMLTGDFAVQRARSDTRFFVTPDVSVSGDRTVSDYSFGSLAGAYPFPTDQGSLVLGVSFHQTAAYERGFDVLGTNRTNSITGSFLPTGYEVDGEDLIFDESRSRIAYESGAIDFSRDVYENGGYPFFQGANPQSSATGGELELEQQEEILESGGMNEMGFGMAVAVAPGVMMGGGLNISFGSYTFERFYRERDVSQVSKEQICPQGLCPSADPSNRQEPYDPYFLAGTTLEGFRNVQLEERIETDISGVNLRFGLSAEVAEGLRGGIRIETPTWYNLTEVFGTEMATDFDCDFSRSGAVCPEGGVAGFEGGSLTGNEFEYRLQTPWRIGGGLQYVQSGLTVAGDLEFVDWTQAQVSADDASFTALNREIRGLEATFNSRVGAEYAFDQAALRAGMSYRPDPRDLSFQDIDEQATDADRLFLSAGLSYTPAKQFSLHLNWMQERFDDDFSSYVEGPVVRERIARNQFLIGVTYRP